MKFKPFYAKGADAFRRAMPRQFTRLTKFCASCGHHVQWDDKKNKLVCPHCGKEA